MMSAEKAVGFAAAGLVVAVASWLGSFYVHARPARAAAAAAAEALEDAERRVGAAAGVAAARVADAERAAKQNEEWKNQAARERDEARAAARSAPTAEPLSFPAGAWRTKIDGREWPSGDIVIPRANLWSAPHRDAGARVVAELPHGTEVEIRELRVIEGRAYLRVEAIGGHYATTKGWLSQLQLGWNCP